jgi:hypothetical protein
VARIQSGLRAVAIASLALAGCASVTSAGEEVVGGTDTIEVTRNCDAKDLTGMQNLNFQELRDYSRLFINDVYINSDSSNAILYDKKTQCFVTISSKYPFKVSKLYGEYPAFINWEERNSSLEYAAKYFFDRCNNQDALNELKSFGIDWSVIGFGSDISACGAAREAFGWSLYFSNQKETVNIYGLDKNISVWKVSK